MLRVIVVITYLVLVYHLTNILEYPELIEFRVTTMDTLFGQEELLQVIYFLIPQNGVYLLGLVRLVFFMDQNQQQQFVLTLMKR